MTRSRIALVLAGVLVSSVHLWADVRTEERTRFELGGALGRMANLFGGRAARDGVTSTVMVKGNRKVVLSDTTGQIIDLGEERVYDLDVRQRTYRVTTFAELRQRMEEARKKAEEAAREELEKDASAPQPASPNENNLEMDFEVRTTGQTRTIGGFDTRQAVATVTVREKGQALDESGGLVIMTDMWLAPAVPAMNELADFDMRYAKQLYGPMIAGASPQDMTAAIALYPMIGPALERMNAEAAKIEGTAMMTVVTVEAVKSAAQIAQEEAQRNESTQARPSGGLGGLVGGLARRAVQQRVQGDVTPRATIMTTTTELLKVATQVSDAEVAIPQGFRQQ